MSIYYGDGSHSGDGRIVQSVTTKITGAATYNGTSYGNISGFNASITPKSTSHKILVMFNINAGSNNNGNRILFRVTRTGNDNDFAGDSNSNRVSATAQVAVSNGETQFSKLISYISSPSSTSSVTYQLQAKLQVGGGSNVSFGRSGANSDSSIEGRTPQSVILLEIAD
tara:strand:+ start:595 stop:1101 length:507 start_codon:yes stop_codon:yes gene_type:complete